jgi:hypothetical protein
MVLNSLGHSNMGIPSRSQEWLFVFQHVSTPCCTKYCYPNLWRVFLWRVSRRSTLLFLCYYFITMHSFPLHFIKRCHIPDTFVLTTFILNNLAYVKDNMLFDRDGLWPIMQSAATLNLVRACKVCQLANVSAINGRGEWEQKKSSWGALLHTLQQSTSG